MSAVVFEGAPVALADGESVLDALLREGHPIPNGCRSGVCQSCLLSAEDSAHIGAAQGGLSDTQKQLNYFLSCQCSPGEEIRVRRVDSAGQRCDASIVAKRRLGECVWLLRLRADIDYLSGQYVTLWKDDQLARSYSLASQPGGEHLLDLHVREYPDGQFSGWLASEARVGDRLQVQGPLGKCFYTPGVDKPLLLAGIGTGLAPLWGIVNDALRQGHVAPIQLLLGAREVRDFYLLDQLYDLVARHSQVTLHLVCQGAAGDANLPGLVQGDVYQYARSTFASLKGYRVYLCGAQSFVTKMRKQSFLAGASMSDIHADSFLPFGG